MAGEPERAFLQATLLDRAATLLTRSFRAPLESVSRVNVASAIVNAVSGGAGGIAVGGFVSSGGRETKAKAMRAVSEAWLLLQNAGLICRDLDQMSGDWWLLTEAGEAARDAEDVADAIQTALTARGLLR